MLQLDELLAKYLTCVRKFYAEIERKDEILIAYIYSIIMLSPGKVNLIDMMNRIDILKNDTFVRDNESGYYSMKIGKILRENHDYPIGHNMYSMLSVHDRVIEKFYY